MIFNTGWTIEGATLLRVHKITIKLAHPKKKKTITLHLFEESCSSCGNFFYLKKKTIHFCNDAKILAGESASICLARIIFF